jgi:hypothetical protein
VLSLQNAFDFIEQVLHNDPDPSTDPLSMVNDAGVLMCSAYSWNWLKRATKFLDVVQDQPYVDLGPDVQEVTSVVPVNASFVRVEPASMHELVVMRASSTPPGDLTLYTPSYEGLTAQQNTGGPILQRLEVWPTPTQTLSQALHLLYRAKWRTVTNNNPVGTFLTLPDFCELLYKRVLRCVAKGYEEDAVYDMDAELSRVFQSAIALAAINADSAQFMTFGRITNGAVQPIPRMPSETDTVYISGLLNNATLI